MDCFKIMRDLHSVPLLDPIRNSREKKKNNPRSSVSYQVGEDGQR